ncbi:MAG: hypothetical protein QME68_04775, partial [Elusimicrobiota bacterium]|nr:hypothetical protein [Elusimicrobiota bacterium]
MSYIKYSQFMELLKRKKIASIYYFYGTEHLLIDESIKQLQDTLSTEISDKEILYGTTFEINKFFDLISS